ELSVFRESEPVLSGSDVGISDLQLDLSDKKSLILLLDIGRVSGSIHETHQDQLVVRGAESGGIPYLHRRRLPGKKIAGRGHPFHFIGSQDSWLGLRVGNRAAEQDEHNRQTAAEMHHDLPKFKFEVQTRLRFAQVIGNDSGLATEPEHPEGFRHMKIGLRRMRRPPGKVIPWLLTSLYAEEIHSPFAGGIELRA